MATHSSILAWKIPWTEKPGRLQSMASQRVTDNGAHIHQSQSSLYQVFQVILHRVIKGTFFNEISEEVDILWEK